MKKENIILEKLDGIYDINPPVVPELSSFESFFLIAGVVFSLSLLIYFFWIMFFSKKRKIERQIKQLKIKWSENKIATHDAAYQLCFLLQQGLNINHIGTDIFLPLKLKSYSEQWNCFANELSLIRYKENGYAGQDINNLFEKSLFWLKVWR